MKTPRHQRLEPLLHSLALATGAALPAGLKASILRRALQPVIADPRRWQEEGEGIAATTLADDGTVRTWLARLVPGASAAPHDHPADEECVVLEGSVSLDGMKLRAGDSTVAAAGTRHDEVVSEEGCLLLLRSASIHAPAPRA